MRSIIFFSGLMLVLSAQNNKAQAGETPGTTDQEAQMDEEQSRRDMDSLGMSMKSSMEEKSQELAESMGDDMNDMMPLLTPPQKASHENQAPAPSMEMSSAAMTEKATTKRETPSAAITEETMTKMETPSAAMTEKATTKRETPSAAMTEKATTKMETPSAAITEEATGKMETPSTAMTEEATMKMEMSPMTMTEEKVMTDPEALEKAEIQLSTSPTDSRLEDDILKANLARKEQLSFSETTAKNESEAMKQMTPAP